MTIETIAIIGFAFAAASLAVMVYERRRMDVLYGPYVEGRAGSRAGLSADRFWKPVQAAADRFSWKAHHIVYLASVIAC